MKIDVRSFLGNWIVKNLLIAVAVIIVLMIAANVVLSALTQHSKLLEVPDFNGLNLERAEVSADKAGVRLDVVDSIYVKRMPRGSIVRQDPAAGTLVKEGRRIQITINAVEPKKIPMPALVGLSLRSALAELQSRGLEPGNLIYIEDMATNNVLRQLYRSSEIKAGTMLPSESRIDLVLGLNPADNVTAVPSLVGMKFRTAADAIRENSLNLGRVVYDRGINTYKDTLAAVVYYQEPTPDTEAVLMGQPVSIYLTTDETKLLH